MIVWRGEITCFVHVLGRNMDTWDLISPTDFVLRDWTVPLADTVFNLATKVPDGALKIAMGGVNETLMAWQLRDYGYNCIIVGETLMRGSEMRCVGDNAWTS